MPCRVFLAVLLINLSAAIPSEVLAQGARPSIAVYQPTGTQAGDITIPYIISDPESDPIGLLVEYSINQGGSWAATSVTGDTSGIAVADYDSSLIWQSGSDLVNQEADAVWFRIKPHDTLGWGTADTTFIDIDNRAPQWIDAEGTSGDSTFTFRFDELVADTSATDIDNYSLSGGLTVASISGSDDDTWVTRTHEAAGTNGAMAGVIDGLLYVAGGLDGASNDVLEAYDPVSDSWTVKASMPTGRRSAAAGVIDGKLYVAGGNIPDLTTILEVYDPSTDSWMTRAPLPSAREFAEAGVINGKLYVVGGTTFSSVLLADLDIYDPSTDSWSTATPMPTARREPAVGVIDGKLYVAGGYTGSAQTATLEIYDPSTDSWTTAEPMPTARDCAIGGVIDGKLYVAGGGLSGSDLNTLEVYDPATDSWSIKSYLPAAISLSTGGVIDGKLYTISSFGTEVFVYTALPTIYELTLTSGQTLSSAEPPVTLTATNIVDLYGNTGASLDTIFTPDDPNRPGIVLWQPGGMQSGNITVPYTISDPEGSDIGLLAQYSTDGGSTWLAASVSGDTSGIVLDDYDSSLTWQSGTDLPDQALTYAVQFRLTPHDPGGWGTSDITLIDIDNLAPQGFSATGDAGDTTITFWFDELVDRDTATDPANLALSGGLTVESVVIQGAFEWSTLQPMPERRWSAVTGVIDGRLYVAGGNDAFNTPTSTLYRYDPGAKTWATLTPMPTARERAVGGVIDGKLYVAGGTNQSGSVHKLEVYDPATDTWTTKTSLPQAFWHSVAGVIDGRLYVAGGQDGAGGAVNDLIVYDPAADAWSTLTSMPTARSDAVAGVIDGKLYVTGGQTSTSNYVAQLEVYDPSIDSWSILIPIPTARDNAAAAVVDGRLYVAGGWDDSGDRAELEVYDPVSNTWTAQTPMPNPDRHSAAAGIEGILYVVGGESNDPATLEQYTALPTGFELTLSSGQVLPDSSTAVTLTASNISDIYGNTIATPLDTTFKPYFYDPNRPTVAVYGPAEIVRGDISIGYVIADVENNPVGLLAEFSTDDGSNWQAASVSGDTSGIESADYNSSLVWQSGTDLPDTDLTYGIQFRLTPHDIGGWGTADITLVDIDNQAPQEIVEAEGVVGDTTFTFRFNEPVADTSVTNTSHISLSGGLSLDSITAGDAWSVGADMTTGRYNAMAGVIDGRLYVVGGRSETSPLDQLSVYDPDTDSWSTGQAMPTARHSAAAGIIDGKLYVAGGVDDSFTRLSVLEIYDPDTNSWSTGTPLPDPTGWPAAGVIDGRLYVVGGSSNDVSYLNSTRCYDPASNTWTDLTPIPTARSSAATGVIGRKLYVAGGEGTSGESASLEIYDPDTDSWVTGTLLQTARTSAAGGVIGGRFYVAGGFNGNELGSLEVYDPATDTWVFRSPLPETRRFAAAGVVGGTLHLTGGLSYVDNTDSKSHVVYDPQNAFRASLTGGQVLPPADTPVTITAVDISDYAGNAITSPLEYTFYPTHIDTIRPSITLTQPTGMQSGEVSIPFLIADADSSADGLLAEYSSDTGGTWQPATVSGDTSSIASVDYAGSLTWLSGTDLADQENSGVWFRVRPHDTVGWGTPDTITVDIDNRAPQWVDARAVAGSDSFEFWFDEPVVDARALNTGNIAISGGLTIDTIEKVPNWVVEEENILWRADPAAVTVGRKLYLIAGEGKDGEPATRNSMEIFDFDTGRWELRSGYPFDLGHAWAVAVGNTIYMGGYEDRFYKYDIGSDTWTQLTAVSGIAFSAVAVIDGLIYVAGGDEFGSGAVGTLRIFNPVLETWSYGSSMAEAREYAAYGVIDNRLYVAGGTGNAGDLTTAEVYDPDTDTWEYISSLLSPEGTTMGWTLGNRLFMVGNDTLWVYDAPTDTWSCESETPRDRVLHAVSVFEGRAYILGGFISSGQLPLVDSYDPVTRYRAFLAGSQFMPESSLTLTASNINDLYGNAAGPLLTDFVSNDTNDDPEIALTPIDTEVSGDITIAYTLSDLEGDAIDLSPRYSSDGGTTWRVMSTASDTAGITSDAYSGTIVWQSESDEPGSDVSDLRVQVATADNTFETGGSDEITFHLDNNAVPELTITSSPTYTAADTSWTVEYTLSDTESDTLSILAEYSLNDGGSWTPATVTGDTSGIVSAGYSGSLKWLVGRDVPAPGGDMIFRLRPRDNDPGTSDSIELTDWSDSTPHITLSTPDEGELIGDVTVDYQLVDLDNSTVDLTAEFYNPGGSWQTATVTGALTGIEPGAYTGSLTWHSATDLGGMDDETAWFRITPTDGSGGVADTLVAHIDNNALPVIDLGEPLGGTWARDIPVHFTLTDAENDVLSLHGYWRNGSGGAWQPITSLEPTTNLQPDSYPDQVTWHSLTDLGYAHYDSMLVRLVPTDIDTGLGDDGDYFEVCNYVGDYTGDMLIGATDWAVLTAAWNTQDTSHDIGPATGTLPWLTPVGDGLIDFEDLAVFSIMWNELASGGGAALTNAAATGEAPQSPQFTGRPLGAGNEQHPVVLRALPPEDLWAEDDDLSVYRIEATEVNNLASARVLLRYDPSHLEFVDVQAGDFLGTSTGRNQSLITLRKVDQSTGIIEMLMGRIQPEDPAVSGGGPLMEVRFREKTTADHSFVLAYDLFDPTAEPLAASVYPAVLQSVRRPDEFQLLQNYPNPFNAETIIRFALPQAERVRLEIYNVRGQIVRTLIDREMEPGYHRISWDGRADDGYRVASGIYIYLIRTAANRQSRKLTIIK